MADLEVVAHEISSSTLKLVRQVLGGQQPTDNNSVGAAIPLTRDMLHALYLWGRAFDCISLLSPAVQIIAFTVFGSIFQIFKGKLHGGARHNSGVPRKTYGVYLTQIT